MICDDPRHDQIKFRAACPTYTSDADNAKFDHHDMLIRLPESEMPHVEPSCLDFPLSRLSHQSWALLQKAVTDRALDFDRQEIKAWISHRRVRKAIKWA